MDKHDELCKLFDIRKKCYSSNNNYMLYFYKMDNHLSKNGIVTLRLLENYTNWLKYQFIPFNKLSIHLNNLLNKKLLNDSIVKNIFSILKKTGSFDNEIETILLKMNEFYDITKPILDNSTLIKRLNGEDDKYMEKTNYFIINNLLNETNYKLILGKFIDCYIEMGIIEYLLNILEERKYELPIILVTQLIYNYYNLPTSGVCFKKKIGIYDYISILEMFVKIENYPILLEYLCKYKISEKIVLYLLEKKIVINNSAIMNTIKYSSIDNFKLLIKFGGILSPNYLNKACKFRRMNFIKFLLDDCKIKLTNESFALLFNKLIQKKDEIKLIKIVKLLLDHGYKLTYKDIIELTCHKIQLELNYVKDIDFDDKFPDICISIKFFPYLEKNKYSYNHLLSLFKNNEIKNIKKIIEYYNLIPQIDCLYVVCDGNFNFTNIKYLVEKCNLLPNIDCLKKFYRHTKSKICSKAIRNLVCDCQSKPEHKIFYDTIHNKRINNFIKKVSEIIPIIRSFEKKNVSPNIECMKEIAHYLPGHSFKYLLSNYKCSCIK